MAAVSFSFFPSLYSSTKVQSRQPILNSPSPNFFKPSADAFKNNFTIRSPRLRIFYRTEITPKSVFRLSAISNLENGGSEAYLELESASSSSSSSVGSSPAEANTIDLKLPRRSLMVQFTCNSCGERTQRLISRLAYERGTVFVQCAGCLQHHKLVDNLGLVVEYDLREEDVNVDANTHQV